MLSDRYFIVPNKYADIIECIEKDIEAIKKVSKGITSTWQDGDSFTVITNCEILIEHLRRNFEKS